MAECCAHAGDWWLMPCRWSAQLRQGRQVVDVSESKEWTGVDDELANFAPDFWRKDEKGKWLLLFLSVHATQYCQDCTYLWILDVSPQHASRSDHRGGGVKRSVGWVGIKRVEQVKSKQARYARSTDNVSGLSWRQERYRAQLPTLRTLAHFSLRQLHEASAIIRAQQARLTQ